MFCGYQLGRLGIKAAILEKNSKVGMKILISGGGRCNFTNINPTPENYNSNNKHFMKSALSQFNSKDFIELVKKHNIEFYEKTLGQLFCRKNSKQITDMLTKECEKHNTEIFTNCDVNSVSQNQNFIVATNQGEFECQYIIVASGGLSFPRLGVSDIGYKVAKSTGHKLTELAPALVPFTLDPQSFPHYVDLAGVSVDCLVSCNKQTFRENILFTHKGLSGPAILQTSLHWHPGDKVRINFLPTADIIEFISQQKELSPKKKLANVLSQKLPSKFIQIWLDHFLPGTADKELIHLSKKDLNKLHTLIHMWDVIPSGTEGYAKAEVTRGGVSTKDVSSKSLESNLVPNLYFIGEVIDVTGWLGGYNFQWAWSSAFACANAIAEKLKN